MKEFCRQPYKVVERPSISQLIYRKKEYHP